MDGLNRPSLPAAAALSERLCIYVLTCVKRLWTGCCWAAPEKCRRAGRVWGRGSEEGNGVTLCAVVQRCSSGSPHCTEGLPTGWELMGLALHTLFPRPHWSVDSRFLGSLLGGIPGGPSRMTSVPLHFTFVCILRLKWLNCRRLAAKCIFCFSLNVKKTFNKWSWSSRLVPKWLDLLLFLFLPPILHP